MANQWFRMYGEFINDPKVQMLSEIEQRRYIMLLCIKCNGSETLHDEQVAFQLRISNEEWLSTKAILISKNLIDSSNNPVAWDKRQYVSDCSTERVKRYRDKMKQQCNVSETPPDTESDTESDKDNIKKLDKKSFQGTRLPDDFIMPDDWIITGKELRPDLPDHEIKLSADKFIDYWHSATGSKATKRDWLATWRNWIRSHRPNFNNVHKFPDKKPAMQANTSNINYREGLRVGPDGEYIF